MRKLEGLGGSRRIVHKSEGLTVLDYAMHKNYH